MQAVILAGGLGTRLWPVTKAVPKPMVPIAGVPYLEHQLRLLHAQEFCDVVLLTGYLGEQIEEYFGDGSSIGLSLKYSREHTPLGTGGALKAAAPLLADKFLLIYGDSYLPIHYPDLLDTLRPKQLTGALAVYDNRRENTSVQNNIALDSEQYIKRYAKDTGQSADLLYVEAGVMAFRRSLLDEIPERTVISLEKDVFPKLISRRALRAVITTQRFYDIGTPERLDLFENFLTR